ncbi:hypothetical protein BD779DRAFT_1495094 [Infundibulicybe gibba]|nr:hypothetical protein BD779DRAFT_1495094 [Infundibulicybe gibba]
MPDLNEQTLGPLAVGIILAALFHGVLVLQTNRYFHKPNKDPLFMKLFIFFIWLAAVTHFILVASGVYVLINHARPIQETVFPVTLPIASGLGAVVRSSVQSLYTYRFHRLTGCWVFPVILWALSTFILGSGIVYSVIEVRRLTAALLFPASWNWLIYSHLSVGAGVDILITASTCCSLVQKRDLGLKDTQRLVNRIMLRIVQTGISTRCVCDWMTPTLTTVLITMGKCTRNLCCGHVRGIPIQLLVSLW